MKTFKFFFFALVMTFAMNVNAQFASTNGSGDSSSSKSSERSNFFLLDAKVGGVDGTGGFGIGLGGEKRYGNYLAWEYVYVEATAPFDSPSRFLLVSVKTGVRGFSPSFADNLLRVYSNLAVGWTGIGYKKNLSDMANAFGLTFGVGLQIKKKYSIGYNLQYESKFKTKSHLATIGFAF